MYLRSHLRLPRIEVLRNRVFDLIVVAREKMRRRPNAENEMVVGLVALSAEFTQSERELQHIRAVLDGLIF